MLLALALLLGAPAAGPAPLWGITLGATPDAVRAAFAPQGDVRKGDVRKATWSEHRRGHVRQLTFSCEARDTCFALPAAADFYFVDDKLASVDLRADTERAPPEVSVASALFEVQAAAHLAKADATMSAVGRQTRYFVRDGTTIVWVQDGPDAQIKLYLDALDPVGRAESVAAGAAPHGLEKLAGGEDYAAAHGAIGARDFDRAVKALDDAMAARGASPLLVEQARLVLALTLAARAKATGATAGTARADLARARTLAPELKPQLDELEATLAPNPSGALLPGKAP